MTDNSGIQNFNSPVSGVQAAGAGASASQHIQYGQPLAPDNPAPEAAALATALEALRAELAQLRAAQPDAVSDGDAVDAQDAMNQIEQMAATPEPDHRRLRRRLTAITDALGQVTALATAVAMLEAAAQKLFGLS